MSEQSPEFAPLPRRRVRRARSLALPSLVWQWLWVPVGIVVLIVGFWAMRPRPTAVQGVLPPQNLSGEQGGGPADSPPIGSVGAINGEGGASHPVGAITGASLPGDPLASALVGNPTIERTESPTDIQESYTVQPGDTLGSIADRFGISIETLMQINGMTDPNWLSIGQVLVLPGQVNLSVPYQRILPDSEMIFGPTYRNFDVGAFIRTADGYLATYSEEVEGAQRTGIEIVEMVGQRYGVGYRPLLALLEHQSGWVTNKQPTELTFPLGERTPYREGLFFQLSWAANRLNEGYYNQFAGRNAELRFADGTRAVIHADTPPGTVALQNFFAVLGDTESWAAALGENGYYATYLRLFGDPWANAVALLPLNLTQPPLTLPWAAEQTWYFTGGPHGGWGDKSGWAALDFVPPDNTGCQPSSYRATAVADGKVIRSDNGEVILDLDGDGFVGTGWTILYMHIHNEGRVASGTEVKRGDPIGHPSCEGGVSDAAHLHIGRRYNGVWIDVDGAIPMVMEGWQAQSATTQYEGTLRRGDEQRETCACRDNGINGVSR